MVENRSPNSAAMSLDGSYPTTAGQLPKAVPRRRRGYWSPSGSRGFCPFSSPGAPREAQRPHTLGGNGVLRAARGGRLGAVAAGALQRVPAAPLSVQLEAPRQGQGQLLTSLHLFARLQVGGKRHTEATRAMSPPSDVPGGLSASLFDWDPGYYS